VVDKLVEEARLVLFVVPEGTKQSEDAEATLAGHAGTGGDIFAGLLLDIELDPFATVRVNRAGNELMLGEVTQTVTLARLEDNARGTNQLRHNDTLGAVDHEGALLGHHGEIAHEDGLLFDLTGMGVHKARPHERWAQSRSCPSLCTPRRST